MALVLATYIFELEHASHDFFILKPVNKEGNNKLFNKIFEEAGSLKVTRVNPHKLIESYGGFIIETSKQRAFLQLSEEFGLVKSLDLENTAILECLENGWFKVSIFDEPYSMSWDIQHYLNLGGCFEGMDK